MIFGGTPWEGDAGVTEFDVGVPRRADWYIAFVEKSGARESQGRAPLMV